MKKMRERVRAPIKWAAATAAMSGRKVPPAFLARFAIVVWVLGMLALPVTAGAAFDGSPFGPVVTAYVYPDAGWAQTLELIDRTSLYALTGAVFARDQVAVAEATAVLRQAAGNFYINDKPTGAIVGQQPFGGARASGTNDKAGSKLNLIRWVSARTIKQTLAPARDFRYPYMSEA